MRSTPITDEQLLDLVRSRSKGVRIETLAKRLGRPVQFITTATNRVRRADEDHVGRDLESYYWPIVERSRG